MLSYRSPLQSQTSPRKILTPPQNPRSPLSRAHGPVWRLAQPRVVGTPWGGGRARRSVLGTTPAAPPRAAPDHHSLHWGGDHFAGGSDGPLPIVHTYNSIPRAFSQHAAYHAVDKANPMTNEPYRRQVVWCGRVIPKARKREERRGEILKRRASKIHTCR
jgi:hypothetical protein